MQGGMAYASTAEVKRCACKAIYDTAWWRMEQSTRESLSALALCNLLSFMGSTP